MGRCGPTCGLYLDCEIAGQPCRALVDTGSTVCLLRRGLLPGTAGPLLKDWTPTTTELLTVTGERTPMLGKRNLPVVVGTQPTGHDFWLADIRDDCIIGLDLLTRWGASVDVPRSLLIFGAETVPLGTDRRGRCAEYPGGQSHQVGVTTSCPPATHHPSAQGGLEGATPQLTAPRSPSAETVTAVKELGRRSSHLLDQAQRTQLDCLLEEFLDIFAACDEDCTRTSLVQHHIDTGQASPIRLRPHRLPLAKRQAAEELIQSMAANGVIEPADGPWAAPVVMVRKDGGWRPCVDYRRLNEVTKKDSYPLPRIDDALDHVAGSQWFSSLDLRSGYWQVELAPEARPKTAFTIGQGLWQFTVMPFGLCNAPATFEQLMERVLKDIPRSQCVVYLDDLLVHAKDFDTALMNLREVLLAIRRAGLRLNPAKCNLLAKETTFLGHVVNGKGVATDPAKVAAVAEWPQPTNAKELQSFLGLASYYRRFVRGFATVAAPLHRLTNQGCRFEWDEACSAAFHQLKEALVRAPVLAYPDPLRPFIVDTDASGVGVGAVLSQVGEAGERVVAYYSCSLNQPARNYCVTRRELLAVVMAVRRFRPYLLGNKFTLRTDHASLTWLLNFKQPEGQVARWLEILQEYDFVIQHRPGHQHTNADALSRRPCMAEACRYCHRQEGRDQGPPLAAAVCPVDPVRETEPFSREQLKQHQGADLALVEVRRWLEAGQCPDWSAVSSGGMELKVLHSLWGNLELHEGLLYRRWRAPRGGQDRLQLLVPRSLRPEVLHWVHGAAGAGHYGNSKTVRRLRRRFYWPGCRQDAELHVHCCDSCTAHKGPSQRSWGPLQQYLVGAPMERVGVDILGPFPITETGNRYVLVAMDYFTKWPEAYAVPDQSATTAAKCLVEEMFARFGVPSELHSDQGRNFESRLFQEVCQRLGVRKTRTTPLHPQSDGLVERFNRTLATQLAILTSRHQRDWDQHLPLALWSYRTAVQESSQCTPAMLMFGRELRTPVDLVFGPAPEPEIEGGPELEYLRRLKEWFKEVHELARRAQEEGAETSL